MKLNNAVQLSVIGMVLSSILLLSRRIELTVDRNKTIGDEVEIKAWLDFKFPGRTLDKYSNLRWHWYHFTGTDWVPLRLSNFIT
jgi:hypothetical protein